MITEETKAKAIAKIKHRVPPQEIADEFDIPLKLINEWTTKFGITDLVAVESNIHAVETIITSGELVPENEDKLKTVLEETAIDIAKNAAIPSLNGDMAHAKAVQLCADAVMKLYNTIIMKGGTGEPTTPNVNNSTFGRLMKD